MRFLVVSIVGFVLVLGGSAGLAQKQEDSKAKFKYIGASGCKMCHTAKKRGEQYPIWSKGPHAKAYETLAGEESKKRAKELGIDNPQKSEKCLPCHVTAYGVPEELLGPKFAIEEGVSCEACHGPGSEYKKMNIMKSRELSLKNGLVLADEKKCLECHNEKNPFPKPFKFEEYVKKIAHPTPKDE